MLGHSRMMWARFVARQDLATVLRCHAVAFTALGGVPEKFLYDRMKTAVLGEVDERGIVYNDKLIALAARCGFCDLDDLNARLSQWLDQVANRRVHGTNGRIVIDHFAACARPKYQCGGGTTDRARCRAGSAHTARQAG